MNSKLMFCFTFGLLVSGIVFFSGCTASEICPAEVGQTLCGYCSEDRMATGNPHGGQCRYCPEGYSCSGDICGDITCKAGGGGGGGGGTKTYYASCSQCKGEHSMYSYNGYSYETCNYYYNLCVDAQCGKILDNCR